ncbi:nuclear transport factor 2 family protein [Kribbella sp. CA-293567]|uniref:nuclear transport factor 2 family protein n=1 Tax=Kribbella sp. CA-293567 TaxID=3002436 RepID=UPI0022DD92DA|nr:nuclear transport factor 2 family protein [Kribbella sp. CA-293567]WBQ08450.1 nuclear transport factor 2 family protein [Kribbella sp. CA-293567]
MTATDLAEIIQLHGMYADIADQKEFSRLPGLVYTDPLTLDFSAVAGIPPMETPLGAYVEVLRGAFAPFMATHHVITGHVIKLDGDRATIHAHVRAEHWVPDETADGGPNRWLVVGFYDNEAVRTADGWRLSRVRLTPTYQENAHLAGASLPSDEAR